MNDEKGLGQFFTPEYVAEFMVGWARTPKSGRVLEPASGTGVFLKALENQGYRDILGVEVDPSLKQLSGARVRFESFVSAQFEIPYDLVIGNPPYVRWRNLSAEQKAELEANPLWREYFSSLSDYLGIFMLKSVELLKTGGELIFITPEYWFNTTHARKLRDYLCDVGDFTDIMHFNETPIFTKVASSFVIFRFVKGKTEGQKIAVTKYLSRQRLNPERLARIGRGEDDPLVDYFEREQFEVGKRWTLAPVGVEQTLRALEVACGRGGAHRVAARRRSYATLGDIAEIGNGMVTGLDQAFQLEAGSGLTEKENMATIDVIKAKDLRQFGIGEITKYIMLPKELTDETELREEYPNFYAQLSSQEDTLLARYSYHRNINYWEWVFPRNYHLFARDQARILVPCKERISHKRHFRFALAPAGIMPTQDVTGILLKAGVRESYEYVLALLNTEEVFEWLIHKGVVKGNIVEFSEKPLASIPMRLINWNDGGEVRIHNVISSLCKIYMARGEESKLIQMRKAITGLLAR